ncbi:uncharacterized protein BO97DRAFT_428009 [Aspergillus homomorphus CBS 101889]|uniref:Uncharacterized protein n=1 Tax=Aspergillus homomorphus (strain CBS 101889) TaxID=1450537 RepID=A0A395HN46_ASPHC|nr:hypothetical protein BO97DRAFT_428009 [Aspergillus homomorphus CBS 101889]RAL08909.1 hypothetical protein BO97DRAFT_428009 [Aspergillus homomorphus CBS 101889]
MKYVTAYQDRQIQLREALLELFPGANANNMPSHEEIVNSKPPCVEARIQKLTRIALSAPSWTRRTTYEMMVLGYRIPIPQRSGYWHSIEHFACLTKSAQSLRALPALNSILPSVPVTRTLVDLLQLPVDTALQALSGLRHRQPSRPVQQLMDGRENQSRAFLHGAPDDEGLFA